MKKIVILKEYHPTMYDRGCVHVLLDFDLLPTETQNYIRQAMSKGFAMVNSFAYGYQKIISTPELKNAIIHPNSQMEDVVYVGSADFYHQEDPWTQPKSFSLY